MADYKLTALELVLTFLTMFGPVTKESLAGVCVLFEAVLGYDYENGKFNKDAVKKVSGVADHLIAMAGLYGVECGVKQMETPGGRRAILRVILGPVLQGLALEDLERMRNDAVEAMMILTFKPLNEVQDMLNAWAKQAMNDGRYQTRVYAWTGLLMESPEGTGEAEGSKAMESPGGSDLTVMMANPCGPALEIVFTFLTMFGSVKKESVAATEVLFGAILGYSEATGKFDKETIKKVPIVGEQLCLLARLYGIRCEPRMLNTPPGARAILRELVGPIIEGHSPAELDEIRIDAAEAIAITTCKPLGEIEVTIDAWSAAARENGRYQTRASAWTGKPVEDFYCSNPAKACQRGLTAMDGTDFRSNTSDTCSINESQNLEDIESEGSAESMTYLEIATSATLVNLVTVQALFSMDILPKQEAPFTTMFPTPLDVCLGLAVPGTSNTPTTSRIGISAATIHSEHTGELEEMDDAKVLMDASDVEDYNRLEGFQFPVLSPPTPALGVSTGSTPEISPLESPTLEEWMTTWDSMEMTAWKMVLQEAAEKEARAEERKATFGTYADAWESKELSGWSAALQKNEERHFSGLYTGIASANETEEILEATKPTHEDSGISLLNVIGRFFGLA